MYYSAIKIFNNLLHNIKDLANEIVLFQNALKRFLLINSFYNSEEYFNYQRYSIENWIENWFQVFYYLYLFYFYFILFLFIFLLLLLRFFQHCILSDVWLTVHRNSLWIRNQLDVTFVFFISLLQVAQHVLGNHVPIFRSWRLHNVITTCWYCAMAAGRLSRPVSR